MRISILGLMALLILSAIQVQAEPSKEERIQALLYELRCLVCQNQSLADSNAELAGDLRQRVRELVEEGKNDAEVIAHLRDRYGDFILYRPPLETHTAVLWIAPFVALGIFGLLLFWHIRRHHRHNVSELSEWDRRRINTILKRPDGED